MFVIVWPSGLASGRAFFNYGWITLLVMVAHRGVGAIYYLIARPDESTANDLHDQLEPTGAERGEHAEA